MTNFGLKESGGSDGSSAFHEERSLSEKELRAKQAEKHAIKIRVINSLFH